MIESEEKAKEYTEEKIDIGISMYNPKAESLVKQAYKDGYEQGQKDCRKQEIKDGNPFFIATELAKQNAELKAQIEKMKCCGNCKRKFACSVCISVWDNKVNNWGKCANLDKWELAE